MRNPVAIGIIALVGMMLAGCAASIPTPNNRMVRPLEGPAPTASATPMRRALACLAKHPLEAVRIGVSDFVDGTGAMEGGSTNSRALSQRPDLMMVTALSRTGVSLVNRSSVNVTEWELNKAMEKKLGEGRPTQMGDRQVSFRPVKVGGLVGSTHFVTGAITELNWNLESGVGEAGGYSFGIGRRVYRISIAIDVMVTETATTRVVYADSFVKQLVGIETSANFFRFFSNNAVLKAAAAGSPSSKAALDALEIFSANLGDKQNEPMQTSLRWVIEKAAFNIVRSLHGRQPRCDQYLEPRDDEGEFAEHQVAQAPVEAPPVNYPSPMLAPPSPSLPPPVTGLQLRPGAHPRQVSATPKWRTARLPDLRPSVMP